MSVINRLISEYIIRYWRGFFVAVSLLIYSVISWVSINESKGYKIPTPKYLVSSQTSMILSFGDPYLAANINYFRVVTLFNYNRNNLEARSILLDELSELNPKHLDALFQAGTLPWEGQVERSISALARHSAGRYWDWLPPFMLGLTESNFLLDHENAARNVADAAGRAINHPNYVYLNTLAAQLASKGEDLAASLRYIEGLKEGVKQDRLKFLLDKRANRLRGLIALRKAAADYRLVNLENLNSLEQLVSMGFISELPIDPMGVGYGIDSSGKPQFKERLNEGD